MFCDKLNVPKIIGVSGKAQAGKSTVAEYLSNEYGYKRFRFADGLKNMLKVIGLTDNQIDGSEKEVPIELLCGKTPRQTMQYLGTEFGRNLIGNDIWVNIWTHNISDYLEKCDCNKVVVEDIRFPNELDRVNSMGGLIIRIERPNIEILQSNHESEKSLIGYKFDNVIVNDSDKNSLFEKVKCIVEKERVCK